MRGTDPGRLLVGGVRLAAAPSLPELAVDIAAVSPARAVTAAAVIVATAIAVRGQRYHEERHMPHLEPDPVLVVPVVIGSLALVDRLS